MDASLKARGPYQDQNAKDAAELSKQWANFSRQIETSLESLWSLGAKPFADKLHELTENGLAPAAAAIAALTTAFGGLFALRVGASTLGAMFGAGATAAPGLLGGATRGMGGMAAGLGLGVLAETAQSQHVLQQPKRPGWRGWVESADPGLADRLFGPNTAAPVPAPAGKSGGGAWDTMKGWLGMGGASASSTSADASQHPILSLIAHAEGTSTRGYNDSFAHQVKGSLTDKTLDEITGIQRTMARSSAIGKYQFMPKTLAGLRNELGLTGSEKFDEKFQDRLAMHLYKRRMRQAARSGGTNGDVLDALAQEWASFPTRNGVGYYPNQHASISMQAVLDAVKGENAPAPSAPTSSLASLFGIGAAHADSFGGASLGHHDFSRAQLTMPSSTRSTEINMNQGAINTTVHGSADADMIAAGVGRRRRVLDDDLMRSLQGNVR